MERLASAQMAYDRAFHSEQPLWPRAGPADPKLGDDREVQDRYNAACAAARPVAAKARTIRLPTMGPRPG